MIVVGLGAAIMGRHGWVPGEGLDRKNNGIQVPVKMGKMNLRAARPQAILSRPSPFLINWAQPRRYQNVYAFWSPTRGCRELSSVLVIVNRKR